MKKHPNLETIAQYYQISQDFDYTLLQYNLQIARSYFLGDRFLELGCATGESTLHLSQHASSITVVEGSEKNISSARKLTNNVKHCEVTFEHSIWGEYEYPSNIYSDIIFFRGLEHINDEVDFLENLSASLINKGRIHIVVPNALSVHRLIGQQMGLLHSPYELNERDRQVGHTQIYDIHKLNTLMSKCHLDIIHWEGIFLKMLSNDQMQSLSNSSPSLINALFEVGKYFPEHCAELYVCVTKKS